MKKILSALAFVIVFGIFNFCSADSYENNPNYYFILSVQGTKDYLYLPSVDIQEYNPPYYKISAKIVSVGSRQNAGQSREYTDIIGKLKKPFHTKTVIGEKCVKVQRVVPLIMWIN